VTDVDTALAKEITKLSFNDRNRVQEEVHGVQFAMPEETPQLLRTCLLQMDAQVQSISSKKAYDHAVQKLDDVSYIRSDTFRLSFVRAAMFDVPKAAIKYIKYLDLLHEFFGDVGLQRPLRFTDLNKAEKECLKEGRRQILPSRDRSGRLIMFEKGSKATDTRTTRVRKSIQKQLSIERIRTTSHVLVFTCSLFPQQVRTRLFIWSIMAEDMETQKKGVCGIAELREDMVADMTNKESAADHKAIMEALPVRFSAIHLILSFSNSAINAAIKSAVVLGLFGSDERVRTKCYDGMTTETHYELMTFGIPVHEIPLTSGGNIKTKNLQQWIKARRAIDKLRQENDVLAVPRIIVHPNIHDVLFSRGGNPQQLGNKDFHYFLANMNDPYHNDSVTKGDLEKIRNELIRSVAANKGRFLQVNKAGGWWEEIFDLDSVHFKIHNAFYDYNRKQKAIHNQQSTGSATCHFLDSSKRRKIGHDMECFQNFFSAVQQSF
jgi:hypothetical protein